ncbi:flippase [Halobacteria archaeon HArc-gm2]|nr:flippase [Halobacteria archaeon HArc-gm2]
MSRNIVSGVLSVVSAKVVTLVIGLVASPLLYRMLGPAKFGEYATVLSTHALLMIFVSSGITRGVQKYVAEDRYLPDWEAHVVGFYFRLAVALATAGALVYFLAVRFGVIAWLYDPTFETYFLIMIAAVVSSQTWSFARRGLMGLGLERHSEPLMIVKWVGFGVLALGFVSLGYGVVGALAGQMLGTLIAAIGGMLLVVRQVGVRALVRNPHPGFPREKIFTYNTSAIALSFLMLSLYHVDVIMLQNLRGGDMVGHYKAALKLAEFLWFVPATIQAVYIHSTSEMWSKGQLDRVANIASKTTRYTLLLTCLMCLGLASLAEIVVPIYWGQDSAPVVTPLLFLLPGALGFAAVRPTLAIEEGHGNLRYSLYATGAAAGINFVLNAILIPVAGMRGAAVATSVGYGSMFLFHVWSARKLGFNPLSDSRLARIAVTAGLSAIPILLLPTVLSGWVAIVVVPPVGLAIFLALSFVTGALDVEECWDLLSAFPGPVPGLVARARDPDRPALMSKRAVVNGQRWLAVLGILLFAAGTGFALATAVLDDGGNESTAMNGTETPIPTDATPGPTTASDSETTASSSSDGTGTVDRGQRESDSVTPIDIRTDADDGDDDTGGSGSSGGSDSSDDSGGSDGSGSSGGSDGSDGSDDTETDTETDTPTENETDTETETDSPTETETDTDTETDTETETETDTDTETDTATETDTDTETDSPTETETDTDTATDTGTETETDTDTATETDTDTETDTPEDTATDTQTDGTGTDDTETDGSTTDTTSGDETESTDDSGSGGILSLVRFPTSF